MVAKLIKVLGYGNSMNKDLVMYKPKELLEDYEKEMRTTLNRSERTIKKHLAYLESFFNHIGKEPKNVTRKDLRDYYNYLRTEGLRSPLSGNSLKDVSSIFNTFFRNYVEMPEVIPKGKASEEKRKMTVEKVLSQEQMQRVLESCKTIQEKTAISIGYSGGVRVSEMCALKKDDLKLTDGKLIIRHGKGDTYDQVSLSNLAVEYAKEYLKSNFVSKQSDYLFTYINKKNSNVIEPFYVQKMESLFHLVRARADIKDPFGWHILRHSLATHMLQNGYPIREVQVQLRHANIQTTVVYTHLTEDYVKRRGHPLDKILKR